MIHHIQLHKHQLQMLLQGLQDGIEHQKYVESEFFRFDIPSKESKEAACLITSYTELIKTIQEQTK